MHTDLHTRWVPSYCMNSKILSSVMGSRALTPVALRIGGGGHFRLQVRSGRDCGRGRCRLIGAHPHVSHAAQPNQCLLTCASLSRGPGTRQVRGLILVCGHKMGWLILCLLFGHILWLLQALYVFIKTADLRRVADSYQLTAVIIRVKAKNTGYAWLFIVLA